MVNCSSSAEQQTAAAQALVGQGCLERVAVPRRGYSGHALPRMISTKSDRTNPGTK